MGAVFHAVWDGIASTGTVKISGVPKIYAQLHAVCPFEPSEKIQVDHGLFFGGTLTRVVDPGEILGNGGRAIVSSGIVKGFLLHVESPLIKVVQ